MIFDCSMINLKTIMRMFNTNTNFTHVDGIGSLVKKIVEFKKNVTYNKVFLLIMLELILPLVTATIQECFLQ